MNQLLKEKQSLLKDNLKDVNYDLELAKDKMSLQEKYIKEVKALSDDQIEDKETQIFLSEDSINELQHENSVASDKIEKLTLGLEENLKTQNDKKQSLLHYKAEFSTKIQALVKESRFYEDNSTCPTCSQEIDTDLKESKLSEAKDKASELNKALEGIAKESATVEDKLVKLNEASGSIRELTASISGNNKEITRLQTLVKSLNDAITKIRGNDGDVAVAEAELLKLKTEREGLFEKRLEINENVNYNAVILEMLKDTGIKTKIIKQYLPVINQLTNQYLQTLDFFVHFNLDESFTETIRSRHRDNFSYDSFSEGEKQRIDLALLFTWRQIAKMKNSVATNLLILDETFDSSLDHDGVGNLMKILYSLGEGTNVFVISHKGEILDDKFESKMEFIKDKNFSRVK
ncbi:MAG: hypothetical protein DWQ49_11270 [Bacteroidetes bacterium]|nr:MAG: hypothetical protein DWQ49_11270 [Bacteroidota bacterium]